MSPPLSSVWGCSSEDSLFEVVRILRHVAGPLTWYVGIGKNRLDRALRLAGAAIDTLVRVDVVLILTLVNAVDGANFDATCVLRVDAGLNDDVGHGSCMSE